MFANNIDALRSLVVQRELVLHQKRLDNRRWSVRRDILLWSASFLSDLEAAIASSHSEYGHQVVLRRYSFAEMETGDCNDTCLREVINDTDVLERVANCLAPGFFKCHVRRQQRGSAAASYEVVARFYADGFEPAKPPCTCVTHYLTDGFCNCCGGHNLRDLARYPRENAMAPRENAMAPRENAMAPRENAMAPRENAMAPRENAMAPRQNAMALTWQCHVCRNQDQKEMLHCVACGSERLNAAASNPRQINNPEDE